MASDFDDSKDGGPAAVRAAKVRLGKSPNSSSQQRSSFHVVISMTWEAKIGH